MKNLFWVTDIYFEIWASPPVLRILRRNSKIKVKVKSLSRVQLFTTPWTGARQVSSVHGILQARILEWVAISFSRGSSRPRDWSWVSHIAGRCFNLWATTLPNLRSNRAAQWSCGGFMVLPQNPSEFNKYWSYSMKPALLFLVPRVSLT